MGSKYYLICMQENMSTVVYRVSAHGCLAINLNKTIDGCSHGI